MKEIINDPLSLPLLNHFTSVVGFSRLSFPGTQQTRVKVLLPMFGFVGTERGGFMHHDA